MIRIFVTGDNHIGLKYSKHSKEKEFAAKRIDAFDNMVECANNEACSLFVITGDLFDKNKNVPKRDIKAVLEKLTKFNGTVIVLPGNHDYYEKEGTVWQDFEEVMSDYNNIKLLKEYHEYEIDADGENVILYPALCTTKHSEPGANNLGWIKEAQVKNEKDTYCIGIAHGAVEGETIDKEGQYFLMTREELETIPMDVWLIGHTHVPFPRDLGETFSSSGKIFNAGTHVQTDVSCNAEGQCFVIEIDDNKQVRAKKFVSGNVRFYRRTVSVSANNMERKIIDSLADISDNSFVDLTVEGAVTADEYDSKDSIIGGALSRFMECEDYKCSNLSRLITKELIDAEFAETSFSGKLLTALLDEPKEAQLVYELLNDLKEGK